MSASNSEREIALKRAEQLKSNIQEYLDIKDLIETGFTEIKRTRENREKILKYFNASQKDWDNWAWQMRNRISDISNLSRFISLNKNEKEDIERISEKFRWAISPYYLSLMDFENYKESPIFKQSVPDIRELLDDKGEIDPMGEGKTCPAPRITRRYPDRLIINVTNQCAMYCRHCQRRRNIGENDEHATRKELKEALQYINNNKEIRDVLITGGDALMLSNETIDWLLTELDNMDHVELKRLGTRTLVTLPQRITPELCQVLENHEPVYMNTSLIVLWK